MYTYFIVPGQIAYNLRLTSNLLHELSEHPNLPSCSEEDLALLFPDGRAAQIITQNANISMVGASFHCIQPDSKQLLIYFKLAAWSEITFNYTTMLWGRPATSFLRSHSSPNVELHIYDCTHYFIVTSQIANSLRLISNLLHGLGKHTNVP